MDNSKAISILKCTQRNVGLPERGNTWRPNAETIAIDMAINALETSERLQKLKREVSELATQAEKDMGLSETNADSAYDYGRQVAYRTCLKLMDEMALGVPIIENKE